jgi:hypothetical protein
MRHSSQLVYFSISLFCSFLMHFFATSYPTRNRLAHLVSPFSVFGGLFALRSGLINASVPEKVVCVSSNLEYQCRVSGSYKLMAAV